jgi:hypothetical protein
MLTFKENAVTIYYDEHPALYSIGFANGASVSEGFLAQTERRWLRRSAPAKEQAKERAEGKANAKPYRGQLQNIRTMKPCKARVIKTVHQWRKPHRQEGERDEHRRFLRVPALASMANKHITIVFRE